MAKKKIHFTIEFVHIANRKKRKEKAAPITSFSAWFHLLLTDYGPVFFYVIDACIQWSTWTKSHDTYRLIWMLLMLEIFVFRGEKAKKSDKEKTLRRHDSIQIAFLPSNFMKKKIILKKVSTSFNLFFSRNFVQCGLLLIVLISNSEEILCL